MNLQRNLRVMGLVVVAFAISAGAALITNNKTNWNGVTNTVTGGRWSYLDVIDMNSTSTNVDLATRQYGSAQDNWCLDNTNPNYVWQVQSNGAVITDGRAMGWAYTATGAGVATISGTFGGNWYWNFNIYRTTDTDLGRVDLSTAQLLGTYTSTALTVNFNIASTLASGNDIVFVSNTTAEWWVANTLDATLSIVVPEPAALSLLALGGLMLFRRRR